MTEKNTINNNTSRSGGRHDTGPGPDHEIHHHYYYEAPRPFPKGKSSKPTIAGALLIITAVIGLIGGSFFLAGGAFVGDFGEGFHGFGMSEHGDVSGQITSINGTGVENATVSIVGTSHSTQTDEDGYYIFYNAPTGNQEIKVEKEGYNTYNKKVVIGPSEMDWDSDMDHIEVGNEFDFRIEPGDQIINQGEYPPWGLIGGFMQVCATLIIIFSIFSLLGGVFAIKRKKFGLAIAGSILGIFTIVGALFAIIALFILIISRNEFKSKED